MSKNNLSFINYSCVIERTEGNIYPRKQLTSTKKLINFYCKSSTSQVSWDLTNFLRIFDGEMETKIISFQRIFLSHIAIYTGASVNTLSLTCSGYNNNHKLKESVILRIVG